nr:choice-of-anchor J domain-containing protein [Paludibacteraceae bacterium]
QVFVQPVKGDDKGEVSLPVVALIPQLWDGNEMTITFEETNKWEVKRTTNFGYVSATIKYPYTIMTTPQNLGSTVPAWPSSLSGSGYGYNSQTSVYLGKEQQEWAENDIKYYQVYGDYVALPEVEDMSNLMIQFYLRGYSDSYTEISRVAVGVMTDPFDPSTFEPIAYCESPKAKTWVPCVVSFNKYKGNGHFPAIMADVAPKKYKYSSTSGSGGSYTTYKLSYQYVDDIMLRSMEGCIMPTDLAAKQADTTVVISWEGNGMKKFAVNIFSDEEMKDTVMNAVVEDTTAYKFEGLKPHTLYYYNVETLCESDTLASILGNFKTECAVNGEAIPYVENFEGYTGGSSTKDLPACWNIILQKYTYSGSGESSTSYYPYIYTVASSAHAGTKSLYFYYNSTGDVVFTGKPQWVTLPMMSEELNKLQFTFWMKAGGVAYVGDSVYVGVMSDPSDLATFDTLQLIKTTANYSEYIIRLDNYKGNGKYIALMKTPREVTRSVYIDDVKVDYLSDCEKIQGVTATDANEIGATISWNKGSATQWEIVVANDTLSAEKIAAKDVAIVKDSITSENPFVVDFCNETNKAYYVYVRALCGDDNKGEWSNAISFKTTCVAKTAGGYGFIDFAKDGFGTSEFPCWTVGRREGTTAVPSVTAGSNLYMFNSTASEGAYAIMPPIDVDSIKRLQVKFTASGGTGAAYLRELTVGVISNPSDLSTFTPIEVVKLPQAVTSISKTNHAKNLDEAQTYIVRFNEYAGDYEGNFGKQIMFLSENGGVANYVYIYSMQVDTIPSCWEPLKVEEVEVNTYDATMGWD